MANPARIDGVGRVAILNTMPESTHKKSKLEAASFRCFEVGVFASLLGTYLSVSLIGAGTALVLIFGSVYLFSKKEWGLVRGNPLLIPLLLLLAAILISIAIAEPYPAEKPLGKTRYLICLVLFAAYFAVKPRALGAVVSSARVLSYVLGTLAFFQSVFGLSLLPLFGGHPPTLLPQGEGKVYLATGFAFHHSPFAATMILLFHVFYARWIVGSDNKRRSSCLLPLFFCSLAIVCSFSRGAWLAWILSTVAVTVFVNWRLATKVLGMLGVGATALVLVLPAVRQRLLDMRPEKNADRLELWRICYEMFKDAPFFGHGFYSFGSRYQRYTDAHLTRPHFPVEAHNMYLDLLAGTGLVGISSFLFFVFSAIRLAASEALRPQNRVWAVAVLGMVVSFSVAGMFDKQFYMTQTLVPQMFFLGVLSSFAVARAVENSVAK